MSLEARQKDIVRTYEQVFNLLNELEESHLQKVKKEFQIQLDQIDALNESISDQLHSIY